MRMKDDVTVYTDTNLVRRRFYLTKEALSVLDELALQHKQSPSILLDTLLKSLKTTKKQ